MNKDYSKYRKRKTRLSRLEEKRNLKQAFTFVLLTIALIILGLVFGFPTLLKLIVWISSLKNKPQKVDNTSTITLRAPTFSPLVEATNSSQINLYGFGEAETKIKIFLNGEALKEVSPASNGEFVLKAITLKEGENKLKGLTLDSSGNKSEFSPEVMVIFDKEKPKLEINSPKDGDKFFGKDREIKISGFTESSAGLTINDRLVIVDSQGNFMTSWELKDGDNELKFKAKDLAGNETESLIKVNYSP